MTADKLNNYTLKDLTTLARKRGVSGWHEMRKDQLVRALLKLAQRAKAPAARAKAVPTRAKIVPARAKINGKKHASPVRLNKSAAAQPSKPAPKPVLAHVSKPV